MPRLGSSFVIGAKRLATFQYIAKTPTGERVSGVITADSESLVLRQLDERELFPVSVAQQTAPVRGTFIGGVSLREVGAVYNQLGDLLRAGVPMLRAIETLGRVTTNRHLKPVLAKVQADVAGGTPLADALASHPRTFLTLHCALVRAGERGGFLEQVLTNLGDFIERQDDLRSKVIGAMIYPALLVVFGFGMVLAALVIFVPKFRPLFANMELPLPTRIMFAMSSLVNDYLPLLILLVIFLGAIGWMAWVGGWGRETWAYWRLKIPVVGKASRMIAVTRFCRILGTMLANGVPILEALQIARGAAGSIILARAIDSAAENVRAGQPLAQPLRESGFIPTQVVEMIAVAEESNQLENVLMHIADTVERRTNRQIDQAVNLIGPLILIVIAVTIGFVAVGLLYPIFMMSEALS